MGHTPIMAVSISSDLVMIKKMPKADAYGACVCQEICNISQDALPQLECQLCRVLHLYVFQMFLETACESLVLKISGVQTEVSKFP